MQVLNDGQTIEVLKVFKNQSNNYKEGTKEFADLLRVRLSDGKITVICATQLN